MCVSLWRFRITVCPRIFSLYQLRLCIGTCNLLVVWGGAESRFLHTPRLQFILCLDRTAPLLLSRLLPPACRVPTRLDVTPASKARLCTVPAASRSSRPRTGTARPQHGQPRSQRRVAASCCFRPALVTGCSYVLFGRRCALHALGYAMMLPYPQASMSS